MNTPLLHDSAGFLYGRRLEPIELGMVRRTLRPLAADVRAIRQQLTHQTELARHAAHATMPVPAPQPATSHENVEQAAPLSPSISVAVASSLPPEVATPILAAFAEESSTTPPLPSSVVASPRQAAKQTSVTAPAAASVAVPQRTPVSGQALSPTMVAMPTAIPAINVDQDRRPLPLITPKPVVMPAPRTGRDARGRFVAKAEEKVAVPQPRSITGPDARVLQPLLARFGALLGEASHDMGQTDPAVQALQEVATPLARTAQLFHVGGQSREEKRKTRWYRRIWQTLLHTQRDEALFHKTANQRLKTLAEKPVASSTAGTGLRQWLPGGVTGIPSALLKLSGISALGRWLAPTMQRLAPVGRVAGRLARRIPLIGSLLALGQSAWASSTIENDYTLSRDEKNTQHGRLWGRAGGGLAGAVAGGSAGAALGSVIPGLGNVIGGMIGALVGGVEGGALIGRHFQTISRVARAVFGEIKIVALGTWDWISATISESWHSAVQAFSRVADLLKSTWEGLMASLRNVADALGGMLSSLWNTVKSLPVIGAALENLPRTVGNLGNAALQQGQALGQRCWSLGAARLT